jgi:hypothetical protein
VCEELLGDVPFQVMPLWRLQRIGKEQFNFLYENQGNGHGTSFGLASRFVSASFMR